jgi:putative copper resistance protein D
MVTLPSAWELASLVCKILGYFGAASIVGGSLCLWLYNDGSRRNLTSILKYIAIGTFFGFQGSLLYFLIQVGMVVDKGFAGMFDLDMSSIFLETQLGDTTVFRLGGFVLSFVVSLFYLHKLSSFNRPPGQFFFRFLTASNFIAFLLIVFSFRFSGHISVLGSVAKVSIALHFLAFAAWIGSLYPLYRLTYSESIDLVQSGMKTFGQHAIVIVLMLILAGVSMLFELFNSFNEITDTPYGQALVLKLILVLFIFAVAALNKIKFSPGLVDRDSIMRLRHSIRIEIMVAILILCVTAYFSTIVGPVSHQMS